MLLYSPGVSIGDGCVIGSGSVVTKSVPAYHLAAGVPARVLRKVASDVPDAPSLVREIDDDLLAVCDSTQVRCQESKDLYQREALSRVQQWSGLAVLKAKLSVWRTRSRHIAVDACIVVAAVSFGYWLKG